jgi:transposase
VYHYFRTWTRDGTLTRLHDSLRERCRRLAGRTFSWINRCRRTVRDYERHPAHHAAMVQWAMVIIMTRRLARHPHTSR